MMSFYAITMDIPGRRTTYNAHREKVVSRLFQYQFTMKSIIMKTIKAVF
jgi:hypothetical protein